VTTTGKINVCYPNDLLSLNGEEPMASTGKINVGTLTDLLRLISEELRATKGSTCAVSTTN